MGDIEINGFDESGIIGGNLRFVRVGLLENEELRFYIYNLIHFGSISFPKEKIAGFDEKIKRDYIKNVFEDPNIKIKHYSFPPLNQLDLLRHFVIHELGQVSLRRNELIDYYGETKDIDRIRKNISGTIDRMKKYTYPAKYVEWFVKSYGYRRILPMLYESILLDKSSPSKFIFLVDGGYPMVFWGKEYLENKKNEGITKRHSIPIFGITNGDVYFPSINFAGNIATILNQNPSMIYPHGIEKIYIESKDEIKQHYYSFLKNCSTPNFLPRMLFFGNIDRELKNCIPYLHWKYTSKIYEPMKVHYPIAKFYSTFRGNSSYDIFVKGEKPLHTHKKANEYEEMEKECEEFGLTVLSPSDFYDQFLELLDEIEEKAYETNLGKRYTEKISKRLDNIRNRTKIYKK